MPSVGNDHGQLCDDCSKIKFDIQLERICERDGTRSNLIKVGLVDNIVNRPNCSLCRLLHSCIQTCGLKLDRSKPLSLRRITYCLPPAPTTSEVNDDTSSGHGSSAESAYYPLHRIHVAGCGHGMISNRGAILDPDDPCTMVNIGSILPAYAEIGVVGSSIQSHDFSRHFDAGSNVLARPVGPNVDIDPLKEWLLHCTARHEGSCRSPLPSLHLRSVLRLIDVYKRCLVSVHNDCEYVALSYVWGAMTKPLLTKETFDEYHRPGSLSEAIVPPTIWDAMCLVQELGLRYLWVDSACIIQDDLSDKCQQLPTMGNIYHSASLVVVAAVENAQAGLPGIHNRQRNWDRPIENIQGIRFTVGQPDVLLKLECSVWSTRGWTYQESVLARRVLIFTDQVVYWNCRQEVWCEDRAAEFLNVYITPNVGNSICTDCGCTQQPKSIASYDDSLVFYSHSGSSVIQDEGMLINTCPTGDYCPRIKPFAGRNFSTQDDVFWAFNGILKSLIHRLPRGFIWGLPKEALDVSLLWRSNDLRRDLGSLHLPIEGQHWQRIEIPSWCWMGRLKEVWYDGFCSVQSMVTWYDPMEYGTEDLVNHGVDRDTPIPATMAADPDIMLSTHSGFARLQLRGEIAELILHAYAGNHEHEEKEATITNSLGNEVGSIILPEWYFNGEAEARGSFILLSSMKDECTSRCDQSLEGSTYELGEQSKQDSTSTVFPSQDSCPYCNEAELASRNLDGDPGPTDDSTPSIGRESNASSPGSLNSRYNIMLLRWNEKNDIA